MFRAAPHSSAVLCWRNYPRIKLEQKFQDTVPTRRPYVSVLATRYQLSVISTTYMKLFIHKWCQPNFCVHPILWAKLRTCDLSHESTENLGNGWHLSEGKWPRRRDRDVSRCLQWPWARFCWLWNNQKAADVCMIPTAAKESQEISELQMWLCVWINVTV